MSGENVPRAVRAGVGFWCALAAFLLVQAAFSWSGRPALEQQLAAARRLAPEQAAAQAQHMLLLNTGLAVLFAAAYAVLGLLVLKQRAWARIAVSGVLAVQLAMAMGSLSLSAVNLIVLVLGGAAAWCCWTRSAAEWVSGEHE